MKNYIIMVNFETNNIAGCIKNHSKCLIKKNDRRQQNLNLVQQTMK